MIRYFLDSVEQLDSTQKITIQQHWPNNGNQGNFLQPRRGMSHDYALDFIPATPDEAKKIIESYW